MSEDPDMTVPVELDDEGLSTDVEAESMRVEGRIVEPFDPAKVDVITRMLTVDLLLRRLEHGAIDLSADYHRGAGVWNTVNQSRLIESMLLRIPLPAIYAAEVGDEGWAIVDGVERLTAITRFVAPKLLGLTSLRLTGLEYLRQFEGSSYQELSGAMRTRISETELIIHLIRSSTPEAVMFNVLERINTGGRPWTAQELRHALIPGSARDLLRDLTEGQAFRVATRGTVKPRGMADREMVLRFLCFWIDRRYEHLYRGDMNLLLLDGMWFINRMSQAAIGELSRNFTRVMYAAADIFGPYAFRRYYRGRDSKFPVSRALFEAESLGLAEMSDAELAVLRQRRDLVMKGLSRLMEDPEFHESISGSTGAWGKIHFRFAAIEEMLREVLAQ